LTNEEADSIIQDMKEINYRYRIEELIHETPNSIIYKVKDLLVSGEYILKMRNSNTAQPLPVEVFIAEFHVTYTMRFPHIRESIGFERVFAIDGERYDGDDVFIISPYEEMTGLAPSVFSSAEYTNQLASVLLFLHHNGYGHGDLRYENMFIDREKNLKLFDLAPIFDHSVSCMHDIQKMNEICIASKDNRMPVKSIDDFLESRTADNEILIRIMEDHIANTIMPMSLFASDEEKKALQPVVIFYHSTDCYNAYLRLKGLYVHIIDLGYWILPLNDCNSHEYLTIGCQCLSILYKIAAFQPIIEKYGSELCKILPLLPFTPAPILRSAVDEERKLIEYCIQVIIECTFFRPMCFVIRDLSLIDATSFTFLRTISTRVKRDQCMFLGAHSTAIDDLPSVPASHFSRDDITALINYYFYVYPLHETIIRDIHECTGGEPVLVLEGLNNCVLRDGIQIDKKELSLVDKTESYFDVISVILKEIDSFDQTDRWTLEVFALFEGIIDTRIYEQFPQTIKDAIDSFSQRQYTWIMNGQYCIRYPRMVNGCTLSKSNQFLKELYSVVAHNSLEDHRMLPSYCELGLLFDNSERVFHEIEKITRSLSANQKIRETHLLFSLYKRFLPVQHHFSDANIVTLNKRMLELDINRHFDSSLFTQAIKSHAHSDEEWYTYYDYHILRDILEKDEVIALSTIFNEFGKVSNSLWGDTVAALLLKYTYLNMYDECLAVIREKIDPHMEDLTIQSRVSVLVAEQLCYLYRKQKDKMLVVAEKAYQLYEDHGTEILETTIFTILNNYLIALRNTGQFHKAEKILDLALENAIKRQNKRDIATMYINKGNLIGMDSPSESARNQRQAFDVAVTIKEYRMMLIAGLNILQIGDENLDYSAYEYMLHVLYESYDNFQVKYEKNFINYFAARYALVCGDFTQCHEYLQRADPFVQETHSLTFSMMYAFVRFKYEYFNNGSDSALDYISSILENDAYQKNDTESVQFLFEIVTFFLHVGKTDIAAHYFKKLKRPEKKSDTLQLYVLLRGYFEPTQKIPAIPLGELHDYSTYLLYYQLYLHRAQQKDIHYQEILAQYCILLQTMILHLNEAKRENASVNGYYGRTHFEFLKAHGVNVMAYNVQAVRKKFQSEVEHYYSKFSMKKDTFEQDKMLPTKQSVIEKSIKEMRAHTHYDRGIYFSYDFTHGWKEQFSSYDSHYFHKKSPYREDLLNQLVYANSVEPIRWTDKSNGTFASLTDVLIIPIIDIGKYRVQPKAAYTSSFAQMMAIQGCVYFDTTKKIMHPYVDQSYRYLQRYINAVFYYSYLKETMLIDQMTKLFKRENWFSIVKDLLAASKEAMHPSALIMTDVDHFKNINDTMGHKTGDVVLAQVAECAMSVLRTVDVAGRYGGEEYVFYAQIKSYEEAELIAERIRKAVEGARMLPDRKVTLSAGVACFPRDGELLNELLLKADKSLLFAKETGRNRVVVWNDDVGILQQESEKKNTAIFDNPSREMYKIEALIGLTNSVSLSSSPRGILNECFDVLHRTCGITDMAIGVYSENAHVLHTLVETLEIPKHDETSGALTDFFSVITEYTLRDTTFTVYCEIENDMIAFTKEKPFYSLIGKIVVEKILAGSAISS